MLNHAILVAILQYNALLTVATYDPATAAPPLIALGLVDASKWVLRVVSLRPYLVH